MIDFALKNRLLIMLLTLLLAGAGILSAKRLPIDAVPDITNIQVQVMATAPALGPLEVERFLTAPVEMSMGGMPNVEEIRSVSQFGLSVVTVVFKEGTDIYWARQQISERLQSARETIPAGIPMPKAGPVATGLGEIYQFQVRSKPGYQHTLMQLREVLEWDIALPLRSVPGVVEINTNGGEARAFEVRLNPQLLESKRIPIAKVFEGIDKNNGNEGGGYTIESTGEQRIVRGEGLLTSLEDLRKIVLDTSSDGTPILLGQVAEVLEAPVLRQGAVTRDGQGEGVVGVVMLLAGENSREVAKAARAKLAEIEKTLPEGIELDTFYDRTELIDATIRTLARNLIEGGVLVVVVLLLLLGSVRAGLVVALAVPLSMLGAFIGMALLGLSGNLMSLGAIDFGLIVDGSVVMIENVVRRVGEYRHKHPGEKAPVEVVRDACREVARPVVFGVGIILLVYLPILSLRGIEGKMFRPMAFTVLFALITSLILALTLMPTLAAIFLRGVSEKESWLVRKSKAIYTPLLKRAIDMPAQVLGIAGLAFLVSVLIALNLGADFIPKLDEGALVVQAARLPSVSLETTVQMTTRIEQCLKRFPEVRSVLSKSGRPEIPNDSMTINYSDVYVTLNDPSTWRFGSKPELIKAISAALEKEVPGNAYSYSQPIEMRMADLIAGVKGDVGISLYGDDFAVLRAKAQEILTTLRQIPGAADVAVDQTGGLPYLRVVIDRQAIARHGIQARTVLDALATVGGKPVGEIYEGQRHFPIQVRLAPEFRADRQQLQQLKVPDAQGRLIPIEVLAKFINEDGPAQVSRDDLHRRTLIQCSVRGRDLSSFVAEAQAAVDRDVKLPAGYHLSWGGQFKNLQSATERLAIAVPVGLLLIFVLLQSAFNSPKLALLIFLNVPLAATGGIILLSLRGMDLSISAGVGFIALFGVAVLNGVVLVSHVVQLRQEGHPEPAFDGALERLRPVLMTALVATLGFVPMALSTQAGAEVQRPLATVVIGGLVTSTLLTLFVVPAAFKWFAPAIAAKNEAIEVA